MMASCNVVSPLQTHCEAYLYTTSRLGLIWFLSQCTCSISHNTPFRTEMCTFLFWMVHCGIWNRCIVGFVNLVNYSLLMPSPSRSRIHVMSGCRPSAWKDTAMDEVYLDNIRYAADRLQQVHGGPVITRSIEYKLQKTPQLACEGEVSCVNNTVKSGYQYHYCHVWGLLYLPVLTGCWGAEAPGEGTQFHVLLRSRIRDCNFYVTWHDRNY